MNAIEQFIAERGVTKCPTAYAAGLTEWEKQLGTVSPPPVRDSINHSRRKANHNLTVAQAQRRYLVTRGEL
jgi:hypothetical protein